MKPSAVLWTVGLGSLLAAMIYPVFAPGSSHVNSVHTRCLSGVKQLATGHLIYASDFDDHFSQRTVWVDRTYPYVKNWDLYHCPSTGGQWGYAYNGALAGEAVPAAPSELPMVYDSTNPAKNAHDLVESLPRPGRHKGKDNVAYADGHARAVTLP